MASGGKQGCELIATPSGRLALRRRSVTAPRLLYLDLASAETVQPKLVSFLIAIALPSSANSPICRPPRQLHVTT